MLTGLRRSSVNHVMLGSWRCGNELARQSFKSRGFSGEEQWPIPNILRVNTITTLQLIMRQQPTIIVKLLIIMRAAGTIEEKSIRWRPRNIAVKRMGTPPLHIRIQTNRNYAENDP